MAADEKILVVVGVHEGWCTLWNVERYYNYQIFIVACL